MGDSARWVQQEHDLDENGDHPVLEDDVFFDMQDLECRTDPTHPRYAPYGLLYFIWVALWCTNYLHIGKSLKMPANLESVEEAESYAADLLNRKFRTLHDPQAKMSIVTFFDERLYDDTPWQDEAGVDIETLAEVHTQTHMSACSVMSASTRCRLCLCEFI